MHHTRRRRATNAIYLAVNARLIALSEKEKSLPLSDRPFI